jgi:hypothetical protein
MPLANVEIQLKDGSGTIIATAATNSLGGNSFSELEPGNNTVVEIQPGSHPISARDADESVDGDIGDAITTVDNEITISLMPNESDVQNTFVDSNKGSISGKVSSADGIFLPNVNITLLDKSSVLVAKGTAFASNLSYRLESISRESSRRLHLPKWRTPSTVVAFDWLAAMSNPSSSGIQLLAAVSAVVRMSLVEVVIICI